MDDFKRAYQEFQRNLTELRASLHWLYIGLIITMGIIGILAILSLQMFE